MTGEGVEVHAGGLPDAVRAICAHSAGAEIQRGEHLERHVGHVGWSRASLQASKARTGAGSGSRFHVLADQPAIERLARRGACGCGWTIFTTSASDGRVADLAPEQLPSVRAFQPMLDQPLRRGAERLAAGDAGAEDLHEVAQHLAVVDDRGRTPRVSSTRSRCASTAPATRACPS